MKSIWNTRASVCLTDTESASEDLDVLSILLEARGIADDEKERKKFFAPEYDRDLHDPFLFSDMPRLIERLKRAQAEHETVGIFGDYDADGITSSVILRRVFERIGLSVVPYIPDKSTEGHGLHVNALDVFEKHSIRLVCTVDCGMMNHAEIRDAISRGMDVIVIDHHHVPAELPEAFAIINPKLPESKYPFRELCGAGTTFKVAQALYQTFLPEKLSELKWLLDLVAVGTVADCVPLIDENRVLVKYGLVVLSKTRTIGFREMFAVGSIAVDEDHLPNAQVIAFQIAPRINAASRMAHAKIAHELLMAENKTEARLLALEIEAQNQSRQKISHVTVEEVRTVAERLYRNKKLIFVTGEHYPLGIVGLVAGKIAHEFGKPTAVFHKGETESMGSFRSIPALSIIEAIEECSDLLEKFGGHDQAAGVTIRNENMEAFYEKLESIVEKKLSEIDTVPRLDIDVEISSSHITSNFFSHLKKFEPFGMGNPEPSFLLCDVLVEEIRCVGNGEKHLKLSLMTDQGIFHAIGFGMGEERETIHKGDRVDVAFCLAENSWNGSSRVELKLLDIRKKEV